MFPVTASQLLFTVIKSFTAKKGTPEIGFGELTGYLEKCVLNDKDGSFDIFSTNTADIATATLLELEKGGSVELRYQGNLIETVVFQGYYTGLIEKAYKKLDENPTEPFPEEQSLSVTLPNNLVTPVDIKSGFMELLESVENHAIIRVTFPGDLRSVILTGHIIRQKLLALSLQKLRTYINNGSNANYVYNRLKPVVGKNEQILKEMIRNLQTNLEIALSTVRNPTGFSYSFWAHLSNLVLREFREKDNKLSGEHDYCRAAYFLGYYNQLHQQNAQKEKDRTRGLKKAEELLTGPPYVFTISDIYGFKDEQGTLLDSRYSRKDLTDFLASRLRVQDDSELLPEIVRLKTKDDKEYYMHREMIVPMVLKKLDDASFYYRKLLIDQWSEALNNMEKRPEWNDDGAFTAFLAAAVGSEDPLLQALYAYELLYLASRGTKKGETRKSEMAGLFARDGKSLVPLPEALRLYRQELLKEAKRTLPLWRSIPVIAQILLLFKRMSSSKQNREKKRNVPGTGMKGKRSSMTTDAVILEKEPTRLEEEKSTGKVVGKGDQARQVAFRKAIYALKEEMTAAYPSLEKGLSELIDEWNNLLDPKAKKNLVEDVNSLVRDYLRTVRRTLAVSPPDRKRITGLAKTLVENKALSGIRKKEPLLRYLELYMVKLLSEKQNF
ncbi:MAG: hypothetical protein JW760_07560 [Spirochaetales bacterium]|nr:hypothetical protein [Spirochaetales bacterium]